MHRPLVGIIVDRASSHGRAIVRGVAKYANLERRWVLFTGADRLAYLGGSLPKLDGAILATAPGTAIDQAVRSMRHGVICSGMPLARNWPRVALDDEAVGRQVAQHLIELGLEHFAYYLGTSYPVSQRRFAGFSAALLEQGFTCSPCPLKDPSYAEALANAHHSATTEWVRSLPKPLGIFAFDDDWASDMATVCREADIPVPDQVAIVGVNNDDLICETGTPPLSSVDSGYHRMGYAAAQLLDRLMSGKKLEEVPKQLLLPPLGVVQRQSSSTLAIEDANLALAVRFIREHACDPCSVSDVLQAVPVTRRWLERQFVAQLDRTVHDEITRVRVETAKRLLLHTDLKVTEITGKCGFTRIQNLNAAFRKEAGTTPGAFRRKAGTRQQRKTAL